MEIYDMLIVGAGPCGLALAIEGTRNGLSHIILEKGSITESIRNYPRRMRFFSTAENIEIGDIPFPVSDVKATRNEALQYYRKVAAYYQLNFRLFTQVTSIDKEGDVFIVKTLQGMIYHAKHVALATGYFDVPRQLNVPGEDLPHVSHYYDEPFRYSFSDVVVVGGGNSGVEAALELYRHDVRVTVVHKSDDFRRSVKYWLIPDIKNRVTEGKIKTCFNSIVHSIEPGKITVENVQTGKLQALPADFVFLLVGYMPDINLLRAAHIRFNGEDVVPEYDPLTFETNVPGLYLAGTVIAGVHTEKVFIENGREHARAIVDHILGRPIRKVQDLVTRI